MLKAHHALGGVTRGRKKHLVDYIDDTTYGDDHEIEYFDDDNQLWTTPQFKKTNVNDVGSKRARSGNLSGDGDDQRGKIGVGSTGEGNSGVGTNKNSGVSGGRHLRSGNIISQGAISGGSGRRDIDDAGVGNLVVGTNKNSGVGGERHVRSGSNISQGAIGGRSGRRDIDDAGDRPPQTSTASGNRKSIDENDGHDHNYSSGNGIDATDVGGGSTRERSQSSNGRSTRDVSEITSSDATAPLQKVVETSGTIEEMESLVRRKLISQHETESVRQIIEWEKKSDSRQQDLNAINHEIEIEKKRIDLAKLRQYNEKQQSMHENAQSDLRTEHHIRPGLITKMRNYDTNQYCNDHSSRFQYNQIFEPREERARPSTTRYNDDRSRFNEHNMWEVRDNNYHYHHRNYTPRTGMSSDVSSFYRPHYNTPPMGVYNDGSSYGGVRESQVRSRDRQRDFQRDEVQGYQRDERIREHRYIPHYDRDHR